MRAGSWQRAGSFRLFWKLVLLPSHTRLLRRHPLPGEGIGCGGRMGGCAGRPANALHHYRVILSGATQWRSRRIRSFRIRFVVFGERILRRFAAQNDMHFLVVRRSRGVVTFLSPNKKVTKEVGDEGAELLAPAIKAAPSNSPRALTVVQASVLDWNWLGCRRVALGSQEHGDGSAQLPSPAALRAATSPKGGGYTLSLRESCQRS